MSNLPPPPDPPDHGEIIAPSRIRISLAWVFPVLAAAAAAWLFWSNWKSNGPEITVRFDSAPGLQAGKSVLVYRGVTAGEITGVDLAPDLGSVLVRVRLKAFAAELAREQTIFWIDQPEISLTQLTGLESIIQGNSLRARVGGGSVATEFRGRDRAPLEPLEAPSLVLRLRPDQMPRLARGAPVYHRGIVVGAVNEVKLDADGKPLVLIVVDEAYGSLVRGNARFWRLAGASLTAGAGGVKVDVAGLTALLEGGLAFDFFGPEGGPVADEAEFPLFAGIAAARATLPPITISFEDGTGLIAGETTLRYRGIPIGLVESVALDVATGRVNAVARLEPAYDMFRRAGAEFSLIRAHISLNGVTGLNTLVNGIYIACAPGAGTALVSQFSGRTPGEGWISQPDQEGDLHLTLTAEAIPAVGKGAPVLRRGVVVGHVIDKTFDAAGLPILRVAIRREFAPLVRANARFWRADAASMTLGPGGVQFGIEGFAALLQGGVQFEVFGPSSAPVAAEGASFPLFATEAIARCTSEPVRIAFADAQGLLAGRTQLRARGIPVGIVESVRSGREHVIATARFEPGNEELQRAGTVFALVRPRISVKGVSGLETVVSGVYIECVPGPGGPPARDFVAQSFSSAEAEAKVLQVAEDRGLEIVVTADRTTISADAPVFYRGVTVGKVLRKTLSATAGKVDLTLAIDRTYAPLVRANTEFWDAGGLKASLGFFWVKVNSTPLAALTLGGIAFATPDEPRMGPRVTSGHRFPLNAAPRREWLRWAPTLPAFE